MDDKEPFFGPIKGQQESIELLAKLTDLTKPGTVYSEPITIENQTIITASEVSLGLGFRYGSGPITEEGAEEDPTNTGTGGGGGGGGGARPVAIIHISAEGVRVEPVIDVTKVALAMFTTLGAMFLTMGRMRRMARKMGR